VAQVEDAWAKGEIATELARLEDRLSRDPGDRVASFASLYAVLDDQQRWRGFRADSGDFPESAVGPLGECFAYADWKMPDKAAGPCRRAQERSEGLVLVDVALAQLWLSQGEPNKARGYLEAALAAAPRCVPALTRLGKLARAGGDTQGALAAWDSALEAWPGCFSCAAEKAQLVEQAEGAEAALPHWEAALAIAPDHSPTVKRFAAAQAHTDPQRALAAYEKAISLGVKEPATLMAAAHLAAELGQLERALVHATAASEVQRDDLRTWRLVAALAAKQGKEDTVAASAKELLRLAPEDTQAHLTLARLDKAADRWVEALLHYEQAIAGEGASDEERAAATAELGDVHTILMIAKDAPQGAVNRVVDRVQRDVRKVFEARLKEKKGMGGVVEVTVVTDKEGAVQDVVIAKDSLEDPQVAASLIGNLRRATISGGAKRYSFELEFK
jgi:tetratricopeptide (TPR) repeat protein